MMKNLKNMFVLVFAMACLSGVATPAFAQTPKETMQERIIRLEVENRVLTEKLLRVEQELIELRAQQQSNLQKPAESAPKPAAAFTVPFAPSPKPAAPRQATPKAKDPYCSTAEIQELINQFPAAKSWAEKTKSQNKSFKIVKAEQNEMSSFPFGWYTVGYDLYITYIMDGATLHQRFHKRRTY